MKSEVLRVSPPGTGAVTCLIGSKRKRPNSEKPRKIRPVLKGSLSRINSKIIWSGTWALTPSPLNVSFNSDLIQAPFYFERTSTLNPSKSEIYQDSYFSGYFCMADLSANRSRPTLNCPYKKFYEREILLRFTRRSAESNVFDIVGSGTNKFGKYIIEGVFNEEGEGGEIKIARNFLKVPGSQTTNVNKRSSRIRTPSIKMMESYLNLKSKKKEKKQLKKPKKKANSQDLQLQNKVSNDQEVEQFDDEYISIFDNIKELKSFDPIAFNPHCRLPEKMKSCVSPNTIVDFNKIFDEDSDIAKDNEFQKIIFNDLTKLDKSMLKELNDFAEFTCPSKGKGN